MTLEELDSYCDQILVSEDPIDITNKFNTLLTNYKIMSFEFKRGSTFWRSRRIETDEIFKNVDELRYPPKDLARRGRMNDENNPVFYIATRKETALAEINIKEGEFVQVAGFRIISGKKILITTIGQFWYVVKTGSLQLIAQEREASISISRYLNSLHSEKALMLIYIDRFLANVLASPEAEDNRYLHTRLLSKILFSKSKSDAIAYPSIKDEGGFNLAVKVATSDSSFENVSCSVLEVTKKLRYGIYINTTLYRAIDLNALGDFIWSEAKDSTDGFYYIFYNLTDKEEEVLNSSHNPNSQFHDLHSIK